MVNPVSRCAAVVVLAVVSFVTGCASASTTTPSTAKMTAADTGASGERSVVPEGFERQTARLTSADGAECELCVWVAANEPQRHQGLMGVTDLGDADAMAFVFPDSKRRSFWMKDTLIDLTILFVDGDGTVSEVQTMEPCTRSPCPTYEPEAPFTVAVEFAAGDHDRFELDRAARFELLGTTCPSL